VSTTVAVIAILSIVVILLGWALTLFRTPHTIVAKSPTRTLRTEEVMEAVFCPTCRVGAGHPCLKEDGAPWYGAVHPARRVEAFQ
jgi:hypothetical protein